MVIARSHRPEVRTVLLPSAGLRPARIGVVADTHARPDPRALAQLAELGPDVILHAGDIGARAVLDALATLAPEVVAVRGNIDGPEVGVPETLVVRVERDGAEVLRILLLHIAVYGPRLNKAARELAAQEGVDLIVCGHSHVPFAKKEGALVVFNPGSIGPPRFPLPICFGWLELGARLSMRHIDCVTGATWLPS